MGKWVLFASCLTIGVFLLVTFLSHNRLSQRPSVALQKPFATRIYTDPDHYFTITIPSSWSAGISSEGGPEYATSHGVTTVADDEFITVSSHPSKPDNSTITISISAWDSYCGNPIASTNKNTQPTMNAEAFTQTYTTPLGWLFSTKRATYQIHAQLWNYRPAGLMISSSLPTPTPVPAPLLAANEKVVRSVLQTFRVITTPRKCNPVIPTIPAS